MAITSVPHVYAYNKMNRTGTRKDLFLNIETNTYDVPEQVAEAEV